MEKCGEVANKDKYKALLRELSARRERWEASSRRGRRPPRNQHLERFKFWLGMPNTYYASDWDPGQEKEAPPTEEYF